MYWIRSPCPLQEAAQIMDLFSRIPNGKFYESMARTKVLIRSANFTVNRRLIQFEFRAILFENQILEGQM